MLKIQLQDLYSKHSPQSFFTDVFPFNLFLDEDNDQNLLEELQHIKLPMMKGVNLVYVDDFYNPSIINKFMKESLSNGTKRFSFESNNLLDEYEFEYYLKSIKTLTGKVTDSFVLSGI